MIEIYNNCFLIFSCGGKVESFRNHSDMWIRLNISLLLSILKTTLLHFFFQDSLMNKLQTTFILKYNFCNNVMVKVFTVTSEQLNASLLYKSINLKSISHTDPHILSSSACGNQFILSKFKTCSFLFPPDHNYLRFNEVITT